MRFLSLLEATAAGAVLSLSLLTPGTAAGVVHDMSSQTYNIGAVESAEPPKGPGYTSAHAYRYPWPLGTYLRDGAYHTAFVESCKRAQDTGDTPRVDCWYTWERWQGENHLQWSVRVAPSLLMGWYDLCSGIYDNIKRKCGHSADCNNLSPGCWCDREVNGAGVHTGYHFFFPTRHWDPAEDNVHCVTEAIEDALCDAPVLFTKGMCYKKLGSQLHPDNGERKVRDT